MTRDEFIKLLKDNIEPNAQMDFLLIDHANNKTMFLNVTNVCMNEDVDDPSNKNRGGIVFGIEKDLSL